ncbi:hypothetical protein TTHERM_00716280 (macronuclear) [Tetrahymena thermophila SB210]|uniref:Uncharacterized protein n=1 Tax=Tetrahymena thermophila (strain SB210) TaxID=312017 RepID=I7M657_TETTS|nr:hypothetical protein TTHERM_00716280 [Tetrahymena thermophila SB210]EAR84322.2 hypothetical protein TTHERM_00716280 [Tetrahymena thermophila SB210]|eukprot:XP_001031985.2 hypothetical protein TTHERM_00716280 [Tetrahymena thermophila SB210]
MNFQENNEDYEEATQPVFQNVINILEQQGLIAKMLNPQYKEHDQQATKAAHNDWAQWVHNDLSNNDSVPQITIQEERKFLYDEKHHHMWYKNINLPTITISVQQEVFGSGKYNVLLDCFGVQVQEDLLQQNVSSKDSFTPSSLGGYKRFSLEGEGIQQAILNQKQLLTFQRIKCKETSYNNKGIRFFIVLYIYEISTLKPVLIRLSPSLYIESRKKSFQETQTLLGFSHPFQPESFTKIYAKCSQQMTLDNIDSFNEYYSSCNIRHKILHPLFLFLKFSKGIKLFYNKHLIDENIENKGYASLFLEIQAQIYNQIQQDLNNSCVDDIKNQKNKSVKQSTYSLLGIMVNYDSMPPHDKKQEKKIYQKVHRFVKPLIGNILQVYFDRKDIPSYMKELIYEDQMKEDYKQIYQQLSDLKLNRSMKLGPSNTQYWNPDQQNLQQPKNSRASNIESSQEESNSQQNPNSSGKQKSQQVQFKQSDQKLKKRPFSSLNSNSSNNNSQIYAVANKEADANHSNLVEEEKIQKQGKNEIINYQSSSQNLKNKQQNKKQEILQKFKKTSETTNNTRNSFYSGENSLEDNYEFEEGTRPKKTQSISQHRKETLSRIPEISHQHNQKETLTNTLQTPQTSIPENFSQTTIYPDLNHQHANQVAYTNPIYQSPEGMILPMQHQISQPMLIPMNSYMQMPHMIQPTVPQSLPIQAAMVPQPVQVVINPYQIQNMYYPYHNTGYGMPMQVMHTTQPAPPTFIQTNMMNYPQQQPISVQNNYQYIQQSKLQCLQQQQQQQ